MKKFITILFLLSAFISNAQNTLNNVGLTNIAPASVAYSVRQLSTSYTGPLVRIKVGNSFYDVYPDASTKFFSVNSKISAPISTYNAAVAVASSNALSTLISASTNATVAIWYDQSGNNVHVLSSNGSAKIITTGSINMMNGQPTIYFLGSNSTSYLTSTTTVNYNTQTLATVNAVAQNVASADLVSGIISTGNSGGWGLNYDPTNGFKGYWIDGSGAAGASVNETSTDAKIITGLMGISTSSSIYSNSVLKGTQAPHSIVNGVSDLIYVGIRGNYSTTRQFNGKISEIVLFPKNLTSAEQAALESSQSVYLPASVTITSSATGAVCSGTSVTFTASTTGISSPSFQWYKNSVAINGATSATFTTTALSNNDQIYVIATPSYTSNVITTTISAGPSATLTVLGDGCINKTTLSTTSGQTSYVWHKDNVAVSGATSNTYVPTIAGQYKVQVSNGTCATMSAVTTISTCVVTADGRMSILETSTTIVSKEGAKNSGKGISEIGKILMQPSPPLITSGLQLYYDAGDVNSYPTTGTTWYDISGNTGRNATLMNNPTFNTGNGGSIYTNGSNQYIETSYAGSATDSYTYSAWFKNDDYSEVKYILCRGKDGAGNGWSFQLQVSTGGKAAAGVVPTLPSQVGIFVNGTSTMALNTWYYLTAVWTAGQSIKVYVNGSLEGTTTTTGTSLRTSTSGWVISSPTTSVFSSGYNAVVQVYNTVLTDAQILQNFNANKTRFGY